MRDFYALDKKVNFFKESIGIAYIRFTIRYTLSKIMIKGLR